MPAIQPVLTQVARWRNQHICNPRVNQALTEISIKRVQKVDGSRLENAYLSNKLEWVSVSIFVAAENKKPSDSRNDDRWNSNRVHAVSQPRSNLSVPELTP